MQGKLFNFVPETKHVNGFRQITGDDLCHFQLKFKSGIVALVRSSYLMILLHTHNHQILIRFMNY